MEKCNQVIDKEKQRQAKEYQKKKIIFKMPKNIKRKKLFLKLLEPLFF